MKSIHKVSHIFQPTISIPHNNLPQSNLSSKSYELMINAGLINNTSTGFFAFLPLGLKALQKLINFIDEEMININAQKMLLPVLIPASLWTQTKRLSQAKPELFLVHDRHGKDYILSPTAEEVIVNLISQVGPLARNQLPLRLYQTTSKWRDEMKPRLGLLRSREFIMKDMYTFDANSKNAMDTYEIVHNAYRKIFDALKIPYMKVIANSGIMGGYLSHEYHYLSNVGENSITYCKTCNYYQEDQTILITNCPNCNKELDRNNSVEVGHTFLLGTKYSESLKATFIDNNNKKQHLLMGCYGLGITRILAAAIEILSSNSEIRWPLKFVPYKICIIPPKVGSKEEGMSKLAYDLYFHLQESKTDVIIDDRTQMTIGRRFIDARRFGYPYVIIIGKHSLNAIPLLEVHDVYNASRVDLEFVDVLSYLKISPS
ncbi:probable proline--tRNA ligase, mitochondrial [Phymastichus coffea]|uniref:probable proline--tRNA ligase, mitochondrial n=1 Tax=Phymastichus coffea TaxID=108790 RepID=UPI00273B2E45|nr:probable proline--tRNA ligase, mitochondrial [Phymastichus coffea]XP_058805409.1 probable proline--tRNA ligase, mitochondrial [Phymastichus coffea]